MLCPQCGTDMPVSARFCPTCGRDMSMSRGDAAPPASAPSPPQPVPAYAPPPTASMPQVAPPPVAPSAAGYPPPGPLPPGGPGTPPAPKKKTGIIIAIGVIAFLLLCCCGVAIAGYLSFVSAKKDAPVVKPDTSTTEPEADEGGGSDQAEVEAARKVVEAYYAAIGAADMDAISALLVADLAEDLDPGAFEGWDPATTFEFTRGLVDGDTATIYGRESVRAYGSGGDGGVKFTLAKSGDTWLIDSWTGVDRMQVEGADTSGSSSGVKESLSEASARDIVTRLLEARQTGNANAVRQLTTQTFQDDNGDIWLDGSDNSEFFTSFQITDVSMSGNTATVSVTEEWNSGPETGTYTVIEQGGALLVDTWN